MKELNKASIAAIMIDFNKALEAVAKKHSVKFDTGNITFSDSDFRAKLTVSANKTKAELKADQKADFINNCMFIDVKPTAFGKKFKIGTKEFLINKVLAGSKFTLGAMEIATGKQFKFMNSCIDAEYLTHPA